MQYRKFCEEIWIHEFKNNIHEADIKKKNMIALRQRKRKIEYLKFMQGKMKKKSAFSKLN